MHLVPASNEQIVNRATIWYTHLDMKSKDMKNSKGKGARQDNARKNAPIKAQNNVASKAPFKTAKPAFSKPASAKADESMRINKYLALKQYASRRGADELITNKRVTINGRLAVLGDTVGPDDVVDVKKSVLDKEPLYFAYNKPVGVLTHSAAEGEQDIAGAIAPLLKGQLHKAKLFPIGRLDKDSHGLIILTNDGRITGKLLDPEEQHEKVYIVETKNRLSNNFEMLMHRGVVIQDKPVPGQDLGT
jgi:23S rRNA-/tRNA-specific pseudouridylate synthase